MIRIRPIRLRALRHIRSSLTNDMVTSVAVALIHSHLDYAKFAFIRYFCFKHSQTPALTEHG